MYSVKIPENTKPHKQKLTLTLAKQLSSWESARNKDWRERGIRTSKFLQSVDRHKLALTY